MSYPSTLLEYQPAKQPNANIIKLLTQHQDLLLIQNQQPSTLGAQYPLSLDAKEILVEVQPDQKFTHPKYFQKDNKVQKITKQPASTIFVESGLCDPNKKAWYYLDENSKSQGPHTSIEIDQLITKGTINMQTKVALETLDKLVRVEKIVQAVNKKKEADQKLKEASKLKQEEENQQKQLDSPTKIEKQEESKVQQTKQNVEQGIDFEIDYTKIKQNIDMGQWAKPLVAQPIQVKVTKAFTNTSQQSKQQSKQINKPTERKRSDNKSMHVEGNKGNLYQKKGYEKQQEVILEAKPKEESDVTINQEVQDYLQKLEKRKPEKVHEEFQQQPEKLIQQQTQVQKQQKLKTEPQKQEQKLQSKQPKQQEKTVDSAEDEWEVVGTKKNAQKQQQQQQQQLQQQKQPTKIEQSISTQKQQQQEQQQQQQQQQQLQKQEDDDEDEEGWQTVGASNKDKKKPINKKTQQKNSNIPGFAVEVRTDSITISSGSAKKAPAQKQKKPEPTQQQPQQQQQQQAQQQNIQDDDDEGWIEVDVGQAPKKVVQSKKGK